AVGCQGLDEPNLAADTPIPRRLTALNMCGTRSAHPFLTTLDFSFKRPSSGNRASISWPSPVSSVSRMLRTFVPALSVPPPPPVVLADCAEVAAWPAGSGLPPAARVGSAGAREWTAGAARAGAHSWAHIGQVRRAPGS